MYVLKQNNMVPLLKEKHKKNNFLISCGYRTIGIREMSNRYFEHSRVTRTGAMDSNVF